MLWDPLLGRTTPDHASSDDPAQFHGRSILITGAAGCIGSALAHSLLAAAPPVLIALDNSEQGIYELQQSLPLSSSSTRVEIVLGNILDRPLLEEIFTRHAPALVFHAAAYKHVPLLEQHPFAAIRNNTLATAQLLHIATTYHAGQFILVSTDKATDPFSIMGASKRLAELTLLASPSTIHCKAVRLGNVLDSPGSIVPHLRQQIVLGQPLTITHPDARRYFMTLPEVVTALLHAPSAPAGILLPHLGAPIRIRDLAAYMLHHADREAPIHYTALRPGDKLEEVLLAEHETCTPGAPGTLQPIHHPPIPPDLIHRTLASLQQAVAHRDLPALLAAITSALPGYQPSPQLLSLTTSTPATLPAEAHP